MARIMITEDERLIAEDLKMTLQAFGHEIVGIASTGEKAVEIARELNPDIIFMDIKLEGRISGIDAAKKIRGLIDSAIVFCTAYSDDLTILQISTVSPDGYVAKPFHESEVKKILKKLSDSRRKSLSNAFHENEFKEQDLVFNAV
ncbi:response regulator [Candidatus Cloacimonadota bacterium]